jgi:hypothetical protein
MGERREKLNGKKTNLEGCRPISGADAGAMVFAANAGKSIPVRHRDNGSALEQLQEFRAASRPVMAVSARACRRSSAVVRKIPSLPSAVRPVILLGLLLAQAALFLSLALVSAAKTEARHTRNVFLITADGLRPEEVFGGAEEELLVPGNCDDRPENVEALRRDFCPPGSTADERRKRLMPFLSELMKRGQAFGNRAMGGEARVTNLRHVSYPGYSEILTGIADPAIVDNAKRLNPNLTLFEWMNRRPGFAGKVAAYGSWDVFPFIFNRPRAGFPLEAGWEMVDRENPARAELQPMLRDIYRRWEGLTYDSITFHFAMDYLRARRPRLFFLGLGETDNWAHARRYDLYLRAANRFDRYLRQLWEYVEATPELKGRTTFVITTDHGRGTGPLRWKSHGADNAGSEFIWLVVCGPDTAPLGVRKDRHVAQNQIAATIASLLGEDFHDAFPATGAPIPDVLADAPRPANRPTP